MATSIDLDRPLRRRSALRALAAIVTANAAMFILLRLAAGFAPEAADSLVAHLSLPSSLGALQLQPWTIVTYFFTQYDALHIILNMLWLCWFGLLMADAGARARSIVAAFFAGGVCAGLCYIALAPDNASSGLLGSSGAVMAVVAASAVICPRMRVDLPLLRPVSVAVAATAILVIDLACLAIGPTGSHVAHIGGILAGVATGFVIRYGGPRTSPGRKNGVSPDDPLMTKLRTSGYDSLSPLERQALISRSK